MSELRKRTTAPAEKVEDISEEKKEVQQDEDLPTYAEIAKFVLVGLTFGLAIMIVMHGSRFVGMWLDGKLPG